MHEENFSKNFFWTVYSRVLQHALCSYFDRKRITNSSLTGWCPNRTLSTGSFIHHESKSILKNSCIDCPKQISHSNFLHAQNNYQNIHAIEAPKSYHCEKKNNIWTDHQFKNTTTMMVAQTVDEECPPMGRQLPTWLFESHFFILQKFSQLHHHYV